MIRARVIGKPGPHKTNAQQNSTPELGGENWGGLAPDPAAQRQKATRNIPLDRLPDVRLRKSNLFHLEQHVVFAWEQKITISPLRGFLCTRVFPIRIWDKLRPSILLALDNFA